MDEQPLLPLSQFIGSKFSLSEASHDYALDDDEAAFLLEILKEVDWSEPVCTLGDYIIRQHNAWVEGANVGLFHGEQLVGFYEGLNLWIHPEHRGHGLAVPLILAAAKLRGGSVLPEGVKSQSYSPSGLLAHTTAHLQALLCALKRNEPIPDAVLREYNLHDARELLQMFGVDSMEELTCCQPVTPQAKEK